eukprot:PhF_6_TR6194/c1_g1_i1/m.9307
MFMFSTTRIELLFPIPKPMHFCKNLFRWKRSFSGALKCRTSDMKRQKTSHRLFAIFATLFPSLLDDVFTMRRVIISRMRLFELLAMQAGFLVLRDDEKPTLKEWKWVMTRSPALSLTTCLKVIILFPTLRRPKKKK